MARASALALLLVLPPAALAQGRTYHDGYYDVFYSDLTGLSSLQVLRGGYQIGSHDFHAFVRNESFDTRGTNLPFQYAARGAVAGVGYRHWLLDRKAFGLVTLGTGIAGDNVRRSDFRAGFAGFEEFRNADNPRQITDLYADLFYVGRAEDTFLNVRVRPGYVLQQRPDGRVWAYGVGQLYASGRGISGTENRVELGGGVGVIFGGRFTVNAELRYGYSFRGAITDRHYFNPVIFVAGNL